MNCGKMKTIWNDFQPQVLNWPSRFIDRSNFQTKSVLIGTGLSTLSGTARKTWRGRTTSLTAQAGHLPTTNNTRVLPGALRRVKVNMDWTWGIQLWPAIALYQQEIVGAAISTWQLLHSISKVPKERSQLLVFHVFAMSLFVYLRDLSTFFRIPTHSRGFRFIPVTGVPESLRWDAINQGAKHGDKTWRSHANSCWNHPFFGHIQTVGPRWKEANWEMKGMSIESFSNGLTILAPSSRMSCTCDMNQWSFQVRYTSDFARPPWQNLQLPSTCHILWRPGSDFVTDIPYHRWDHELYYDSDPNCWMQAPVMAYRVVQRGRVLWNLVIFRIFSFQVWFRYGECECVCVWTQWCNPTCWFCWSLWLWFL